MSDFKVGICLFDDADRLEGGWASINGEDAVRIRTHADLTEFSNTIFVTNSTYNSLRATGMLASSYIRMDSYFRTTIQSLVSEFDMSMRDSPRHEIVKKISPVLAATIACAHRIFDRLESNHATLSKSMFAMVPEKLQPQPNRSDEDMLKSAWQESSSLPSKWEAGFVGMMMNVNRARHANMVLSSPVPDGTAEISNVTGHGVSIESLIASGDPIAVMADIEWKNSSVAEMCAIGTGGASFTPGKMREWYLLPEVLMLEPFARFNIHKIATWPRWKSVYVPEGLFGDDIDKMSISSGLVAESYLNAIMSRQYNKTVKYFHPVESVWLRATDRALSFGAAKRLIDSGIHVSQYGFGRIRCSAMKEDIDRTLDIAAECGFFSCSVFGGRDVTD